MPTPFLKWAGGKRQLLEQMSPHFPDGYDVYFEPFLGGGATFFYLLSPKAILSDSNDELINVFQQVRDNPDDLMNALDRHYPHRNNREYFDRIRAEDPSKLSAAERAARATFLNKTCYNGLYRVNSKNQFNVPFGRHKNPVLYSRENIMAASRALKGKIVTTADYRAICEYARSGDFIYLDPPYQPLSSTASFTSYTRDAFDEKDQEELCGVFKSLDQKSCKVMLSNSATELIHSLYDGYHIVRVRATRAINCKPSRRGVLEELLIMNYR